MSELADALFSGIMLALAVSSESSSINLPADSVIDVTFPGPQGGSIRITGRITAGLGWLRYDLTNFGENGVVWNGSQVFRRLQLNNGQQDSLTEVHLHDLRTQSPLGDVTLRGSITQRSTLHQFTPPSSIVTGTIEYRNNSTQESLLAEDVEISSTPDSQLNALIDGSGRLYHGSHGWIDFEFSSPWGVPAGEFFPILGGPLVATTGSGAFFEIETLNADLVSLQYTKGSSTFPNRAARVIWPLLFTAQTGQAPLAAPIADGGPSRYTPTDVEILLDAAYSTHPQTNYTDFQWELVFRPPGSQAALSASTAVQPTLTLDRPGRYLYRLTATDGTRSDSDYVVLTADNGANNPLTPLELQLPPRATVSVNSTVNIDLSRFRRRGFDDRGPTISAELITPTGSGSLPVSNLNATFQPASPGVYVAVVSNGSLGLGGVRPADFMTIEVDAAQRFAPAVTFPVPEDASQAALGDLNADGLDDLVFGHGVGASAVAVYLSNGTGFAEPLTLPGGQGGHVRIGDVNNDGRADIVSTVSAGLSVFQQQADGSFSNEILIPGNCNFDPFARPVMIADINGDGRNDVLADSTCNANAELFLQQQDGSLAPGSTVVTAIGTTTLAVGDLDDDGHPDLAVAVRDGSLPGEPSVRIHYGNPDGSLAAPTYLAAAFLHIETPALGIADLNGDGRDDLVVSRREQIPPARRQVHVFLQDGSGNLDEWQVFDVAMDILALKLVDADGDGAFDIVLDALAPSLNIHFQRPDRTFDTVPTRAALHFERESRVPPEAAGDVNGDGLVDIAFLRAGTFPTAVLMFGSP